MGKPKIVNCDCEEWLTSWPQIVQAQIWASKHGQIYTGAVMVYCPWCREMLQEDE